MDKPTRDELAAKHRDLLRRGNPRDALRSRSHDFEFAFEVHDGWLPIVDSLLTSLTEAVAALQPSERETFSICQIKEKFGMLTVYYESRHSARHIKEQFGMLTMHYEPRHSAIDAAIAQAAEHASRTCERCGDHGLMLRFGTFYAVRCKACAAVLARDRKCEPASIPDNFD